MSKHLIMKKRFCDVLLSRVVMTFGKALLAVITLVGLGVSPAMATVTTYSTQASFLAANTPDATVNFNGIAPAGSDAYLPSVNGLSTHSVISFSTTGSTSNSNSIAYSKTYPSWTPIGSAFGNDYYSQNTIKSFTMFLPGSEGFVGFQMASATGDNYASITGGTVGVTVNRVTYNIGEASGKLTYFGIN